MAHIDELIAQDSALWAAAKARGESGPRVLLATSMGGFNHGAVTDKALAIGGGVLEAILERYNTGPGECGREEGAPWPSATP